MKKKSRFIGNFVVILAALMWGCNGVFTRKLYEYDGVRAIDIVIMRAFFTSLILFAFLMIFKRDLLIIKLKHIPIFLGSGIASFLFFNYCYMSSIAENSLSVACILMYTSPIWITIIAAIFFKERVSPKRVIVLALAILGCALVSFQGETRITKIGLIYGLLSGFGYALYSIFGRVGVKYYSSITVTFYTFVFATLGGLPFLFSGKLPTIIAEQPSCLVWGIITAVWTTTVPYALYTYGLSLIPASVASIISIIEPIMATVMGFVFFSEKLTVGSFIGIVIVVAALVLLELPVKFRRRKKEEAKSESQ